MTRVGIRLNVYYDEEEEAWFVGLNPGEIIPGVGQTYTTKTDLEIVGTEWSEGVESLLTAEFPENDPA